MMTSIRRHPRMHHWARRENIQRVRGGKPPLPPDNFGGLWRGGGSPPPKTYRLGGTRRPKNTLLQMRGPGGAQGASFWADSQGNTSALDAQTAGRVRQEFASGGQGPTISGLMGGGRTGGGGFGQSPPSTSYMGGGMPGMGGGMRGGFGGGFGGRRGGGGMRGGFGGGRAQSNAFSNYSRSLRNRRTF